VAACCLLNHQLAIPNVSTMGNMADESDHPNVFVAIASPSTEPLNFSWDGNGIKEDGKFQN
jgi:hypothetical protein